MFVIKMRVPSVLSFTKDRDSGDIHLNDTFKFKRYNWNTLLLYTDRSKPTLLGIRTTRSNQIPCDNIFASSSMLDWRMILSKTVQVLPSLQCVKVT